MVVQALDYSVRDGLNEVGVVDVVQGFSGDFSLVPVSKFFQVVVDDFPSSVRLIGGGGIQGRPAGVAEPRAVPERRSAVRARFQRGSTDIDVFVVLDTEGLPETSHHPLVGLLVVAFQDIGVGADTDHELDSVVGDVVVTHARDGSVPEVVRFDLLGVDVSGLGKIAESVTDLTRGDGVALFPRDEPTILMGSPTGLRAAEQRGVLIVLSRMRVSPRLHEGLRPQQRSRTGRALETLGVVVESDAGGSTVELQVTELDREGGADPLASDSQEGDKRGVAWILGSIEERVDVLTCEDMVLGDGCWVGSPNRYLVGPLVAEVIPQEELDRLPVLTDCPVRKSAGGDVRVRPIGEAGEQFHDLVLALQFGEKGIGALGSESDRIESVSDRRDSEIAGEHVVGPASDGVPIGLVVEFANLVELALGSIGEARRVVNIVRHDDRTSEVESNYTSPCGGSKLGTSSSNTEETTNRRNDDTSGVTAASFADRGAGVFAA